MTAKDSYVAECVILEKKNNELDLSPRIATDTNLFSNSAAL